MWHEVGHAMGQDHNNDKNNIMYEKGTGTKYQYDYSKTITLSDGYSKKIRFCNSGSVYFTTERVSSAGGYKVYVIGSGANQWDVINGKAPFYTGCSAYETTWKSFSNSCNVESGSSLVIYNPSVFGAGSDSQIKVKIYNQNPPREMNLSFYSDSRYFSQDYLNHVKELFRGYGTLNAR